MFSKQELLAFEVNSRHQGPASHLSLGEGAGLRRKTARGGTVVLILERAVCTPASWALSEYPGLHSELSCLF